MSIEMSVEEEENNSALLALELKFGKEFLSTIPAVGEISLDYLYDGDKDFQRLLDELFIIMPIHHIKMYILGILHGPDTPSLSYVIDEILTPGDEEEIYFQAEEQVKRFLSSLYGLWNDIASYLDSGRHFELKPFPKDFNGDNEDRFIAIKDKHEELSHFLAGVNESGGKDVINGCFELFKITFELSLVEEGLDAFIYTVEMEGYKPDKDFELVSSMCLELTNETWPTVYLKMSNLFKDIRLGKIKLESPEVVEYKFNKYMKSREEY